MQEHVIQVAVVCAAPDRRTAHEHVQRSLPRPVGYTDDTTEPAIDSWWIAEDDRTDGSDCDSAVFVSPGNQALASTLLQAVGLTPHHNVVVPVGGQFADADASVNPTMDEVKTRLRRWLGDSPSVPLPEGHTLVVLVTNAPGDAGAQYTLTLPDGQTALIGDAQDEYGELAAIIDDAFEETK